MSLDQMNSEWNATGLQHIKECRWHELRRRTCPHGVLLTVTDSAENNVAFAAVDDDDAGVCSTNDISTEEYIEKERFAERAMSMYARKRETGGLMPEGSTWLDLAFEAVNINALSSREQAKICLCMGNLFAWVADFSGADELYTYALDLDDLAPGARYREWRPTLLANRTLCRLRQGHVAKAAVDAHVALKEAGPRWGIGLARFGQVMCALGEWEKAGQIFVLAQTRCREQLVLQAKISLARTSGCGNAAAAAAGTAAVAAVIAARKLDAIANQLEHVDSAVQLSTLQRGDKIELIMGPTPRFLADVGDRGGLGGGLSLDGSLGNSSSMDNRHRLGAPQPIGRGGGASGSDGHEQVSNGFDNDSRGGSQEANESLDRERRLRLSASQPLVRQMSTPPPLIPRSSTPHPPIRCSSSGGGGGGDGDGDCRGSGRGSGGARFRRGRGSGCVSAAPGEAAGVHEQMSVPGGNLSDELEMLIQQAMTDMGSNIQGVGSGGGSGGNSGGRGGNSGGDNSGGGGGNGITSIANVAASAAAAAAVAAANVNALQIRAARLAAVGARIPHPTVFSHKYLMLNYKP